MLTEERLQTIEHVIAGVAAFIVFVCTVGSPRINWGPTREQLAKAFVRDSRHIAQLQSSLLTAEGHIKTQIAELAAAGKSTTGLQAQLNTVMKERDAINKQAGSEAAKVKELEAQLKAAKAEIAKLKDDGPKEEMGKKLDAAVARANKAEDRVRELTLQLHNAGIWP